jgi:pectate lyase
MKTHKLLFLAGLLACALFSQAQDYVMNSPVGYGAGTTGGGSATPTVVTTAAALKTALTSTTAGVVIVSGTITIPSGGMIKAVIKNKTLLGLPGAKLVNNTQTASGGGILYLSGGSTNVIIRNLIFEGPGAYDADGNDNLCADGCTKLWVDHCTFQDGMDGNFDNKGNTDNVTVSWCKFEYKKAPKAGGSGGSDDHRYTNLVGSSSSDKPSDGLFSITWKNCWWAQGCVERMTRARNAQLHFLNCYWNSTVAKCNLGLENATAYVENSTFTSSSSVIYKSYGGTVNLKFVGCTGSLPSNLGTVPTPSYSYTPLAGTQTVSAVTNASCGAGATLLVTTSGAISSSCSGGTVITQPTIALTSGAASQTITLGATIANIVYTYGGSGTGATVTGLPAGVTAATNTTAKTITISGTPTATGTSSFTATTTQSSGTAVSLNGSIVVNAAPVAQPTLTLTSGTASQSITIGAAITNVVYTLGGSATGATVTGLPAGVSATTSGTTITISGTPTATGTSNFTATTTQSSGTAVSKTGSIVVNAVPVAQPTLSLTSGTASQTITIGAAITNIVYTLGGSATGATVAGLPAGVTSTISSTTVTISGTPSATGSSSFTVTTTQSSGTAISLSGSLVVNAVGTTTQATETFESLTSVILSTGSDKTQDLPINGLTWKVEKARLNTSASYAHAGNNSLRLLYNTGAVITPLLTGAQTVSFWVAGANASYKPKLEVYKSIDGGATWVATAILSTTVTSTSFYKVSVTINESSENVKLKICNKGGVSATSSNNFYIDDIMYTASSMARSASISEASITTEEQEVTTLALDANELYVSGVDVSSLIVYSVSGSIVASSNASQIINISTLPKGVYVLQINATDNTVTTKKFIKQ